MFRMKAVGDTINNDGIDIFYGFGAMVKATDKLSIGARYKRV